MRTRSLLKLLGPQAGVIVYLANFWHFVLHSRWCTQSLRTGPDHTYQELLSCSVASLLYANKETSNLQCSAVQPQRQFDSISHHVAPARGYSMPV